MNTTRPIATVDTGAVSWQRVGVFYGVAFTGAVAVAGVIWWLREAIGASAAVPALAVAAFLYMPLPLIAGLVVERMAGRELLIVEEWRKLRRRFWSQLGRNASVAVTITAAILVVALATAWLAGLLDLPGAGHLVRDDTELQRRMAQVVPGLATSTALPSAPVLAVTVVLQGLLAGVTVNGLFAFGEEYGWRGVLARELRPLGAARATLLTGILWGFWHAPIIMLGHDYGAEWRWGIVAMIAWTIPLSFLLTWARERTGSLLAPAMLHGCYNGTIGLFLFLIVDGHILISLPMGVLMAFSLTLLAAVVWLALGRRTFHDAPG